jgi:hypothetical protein
MKKYEAIIADRTPDVNGLCRLQRIVPIPCRMLKIYRLRDWEDETCLSRANAQRATVLIQQSWAVP